MRIPVALTILCLGYVSSVGPASVIADRHPVLDQYLQFYYALLILVVRRTPFGGPLIQYERFWRDTFR